MNTSFMDSNNELQLMEVLEAEICSYDLKEPVNELGSEVVTRLLNSGLNHSNICVLLPQIGHKKKRSNPYEEELMLFDHWLTFEKPTEEKELEKVIKTISKNINIKITNVKADRVTIVFNCNKDETVDSIHDVHREVNRVGVSLTHSHIRRIRS